VTNLAAALKFFVGMTSYKTELQQSRRLEMNAWSNVFAASRDKDCSGSNLLQVSMVSDILTLRVLAIDKLTTGCQ